MIHATPSKYRTKGIPFFKLKARSSNKTKYIINKHKKKEDLSQRNSWRTKNNRIQTYHFNKIGLNTSNKNPLWIDRVWNNIRHIKVRTCERVASCLPCSRRLLGKRRSVNLFSLWNSERESIEDNSKQDLWLQTEYLEVFMPVYLVLYLFTLLWNL